MYLFPFIFVYFHSPLGWDLFLILYMYVFPVDGGARGGGGGGCSAVVSGTMPLVQTQNNCVGGASVLSLRYYLSLSA